MSEGRMTLSQVVERLTERRGASSSVTLKTTAAGAFTPELVIAAGTPDEEVDHMLDVAIAAYTRLHTEAAGVVPSKDNGAKDEGQKQASAAAAIARNRARRV